MQIQFYSVKDTAPRQVGVIINISKSTSICIVSSGGHKALDIKTKLNHGLASKMLILWEL